MEYNGSLKSVQNNLQKGNYSCVDLVNYFIGQIKKQSRLNAFLEVFDYDALQTAKEIDEKIKTGNAGKLAGLVIGIKDNL